jgi:hypothetical protein
MIAAPNGLDLHSIRHAVEAEGSGVDYDRVEGVSCPACGISLIPGKAGVYCTKRWDRGQRIRHHDCPLCGCGFKSTERL